jgi:Uma2 family endonuclease
MQMALRTRRWRRADLASLPDDGNRYELVGGELFVTPAPSPRHQRLVYRLAALLRGYVETLGPIELRQAPDAVVFDGDEVQPDILVRPAASPEPDTWDDMPTPFLVVEIASGTTRRRDTGPKLELYVTAGIDGVLDRRWPYAIHPSHRHWRGRDPH